MAVRAGAASGDEAPPVSNQARRLQGGDRSGRWKDATERRTRSPRLSSVATARLWRGPRASTTRRGTSWQVLQHTDGLEDGQIGAYLRREGLYWSHLSTWRKQRAAGTLAGLQPRKRGRKELSADERLSRRVAQLEKEKAAVEEELRKARLVAEVQKKVLSLCEDLGLSPDASSSRS